VKDFPGRRTNGGEGRAAVELKYILKRHFEAMLIVGSVLAYTLMACGGLIALADSRQVVESVLRDVHRAR
jgi:hypothetical protein